MQVFITLDRVSQTSNIFLETNRNIMRIFSTKCKDSFHQENSMINILHLYITDHSPIHQKLLFYCLFKLLTLLMYFMSDNKMAVGGGSGHKSFLHHDTYSGLWRRDLVLNSSNSSITNNSSSVSSSGVRLTSVRHKREDSDDIRSDTSSDNLIDDNDDSDSNNPGPVEIRFYLKTSQYCGKIKFYN